MFWLAFALALVSMIILGILTEKIVLRPLVNQPHITLFMATIGLLPDRGHRPGRLGAPTCAASTWASRMCRSNGSWRAATSWCRSSISSPRASPACWWPRWRCCSSTTKIGRALRAVADDHQAALSIGIPLQHIWVIVWGVAGFVALIAGMIWGARNGVQFALTYTALRRCRC